MWQKITFPWQVDHCSAARCFSCAPYVIFSQWLLQDLTVLSNHYWTKFTGVDKKWNHVIICPNLVSSALIWPQNTILPITLINTTEILKEVSRFFPVLDKNPSPPPSRPNILDLNDNHDIFDENWTNFRLKDNHFKKGSGLSLTTLFFQVFPDQWEPFIFLDLLNVLQPPFCTLTLG